MLIKGGYGTLPRIVGHCHIKNWESMLYLYLPISLPGMSFYSLPVGLEKWKPIIEVVKEDIEDNFNSKYVYLTVKAMFVSGGNTNQRPGWHSDGFMTEDLNYIWYDRNPTEFYFGDTFSLVQEHQESMEQMESMCRHERKTEYPSGPVLRLDERVVHRPQNYMLPGFRNFVKVSVSDHIYALKGNSLNRNDDIYCVTKNWEYKDRMENRNCPVSQKEGVR